jgi:hypothetical protein
MQLINTVQRLIEVWFNKWLWTNLVVLFKSLLFFAEGFKYVDVAKLWCYVGRNIEQLVYNSVISCKVIS